MTAQWKPGDRKISISKETSPLPKAGMGEKGKGRGEGEGKGKEGRHEERRQEEGRQGTQGFHKQLIQQSLQFICPPLFLRGSNQAPRFNDYMGFYGMPRRSYSIIWDAMEEVHQRELQISNELYFRSSLNQTGSKVRVHLEWWVGGGKELGRSQ